MALSFFRIASSTPNGTFPSDSTIEIILRSNASSAVVGESILLFGSVTPYNLGQRVFIYRNGGNGWEEYASGPETLNGSFSFSFITKSQGIYQFKARIVSQNTIFESEEIIIRCWHGSIFSRLLIEDANLIDLTRLRLFRKSLSNGSVLDRGIYSAFVFVNGGISSLADSLLWPVLRFTLYPALWSLQASGYLFTTYGNSEFSLISYSLLFGLAYLTAPIFLIGYLSKIGLTPIRWKRILGIPASGSVISLLIIWVSPFPELVGVSALLAFVSTALLPSLSLAKFLYL